MYQNSTYSNSIRVKHNNKPVMDCKYPQSFKYEKIQKELSILPSHISFNQKFIDYGEVSIPKSLWKKYPILRTRNVYQDFGISKFMTKLDKPSSL
jgi:hypothetical protein